ncbi:MAG: 4-hydroxy-tetrahydrodipicolinate reductase [Actinomycetes bacterium]
MINVGVIGAAGRMGQAVIAAVEAAPDLTLSAVIDPRVDTLSVTKSVIRATSVAELPDAAAEVLVDFTVAEAARLHLAPALVRGIHLVVGTTGLTLEDLDALEVASAASGANAVVAPNFALSAVLLMRFAEQAARYFEGVEIIELHHDNKVDAPSGTAMATAERIAEARAIASLEEPHDPTTTTVLQGARGGVGPGGLAIHSVRLPGLIAHEEVLFGNPGEGLTLRHDTYDRSAFMAGVLLAVRSVASRPGVTRGLDPLLDE